MERKDIIQSFANDMIINFFHPRIWPRSLKMLLDDSAQITRHIAGHITTNDSSDVYEVEVVDNDDVRIIRHEARMAAGAKPVLNAAECVICVQKG